MMRTAIAVVTASVTVLAQDPPKPFRSGADATMLNVSVFDGDRVVPNLRASDFDVIDNGVKQTLTVADFNKLPVDLRLVFDTSGSISDEELQSYLKMMQEVAGFLDLADRGEILSFSSKLAEAADRRHPPLKVNLQRNGQEGTAFFDAAIAALTTVKMPDRRQVTILLSDAIDNSSFFDEGILHELARRTDAVVYTVLPGNSYKGRAVSETRLETISQFTGGKLVRTSPIDVADRIIDTIQEVRQSYLLRYEVTGVPLPGWHKVSVKVKGGGYKVRTKPGYFGK